MEKNWVEEMDALADAHHWMAPLYQEVPAGKEWGTIAIVRNEEYFFRAAIRATPAAARSETARLLHEMLAGSGDCDRGIPAAPTVTAIVMAHRIAAGGSGQITPTASCSEQRYCICDELGMDIPPINKIVWMQIGCAGRGALTAMPLAQRALLGILWLVRHGHRLIAIYCDAEDVLPINLALNAVGLRFAPAMDRASAAVLRVSA